MALLAVITTLLAMMAGGVWPHTLPLSPASGRCLRLDAQPRCGTPAPSFLCESVAKSELQSGFRCGFRLKVVLGHDSSSHLEPEVESGVCREEGGLVVATNSIASQAAMGEEGMRCQVLSQATHSSDMRTCPASMRQAY